MRKYQSNTRYGRFYTRPTACSNVFGAWAFVCMVLSILVLTGVLR